MFHCSKLFDKIIDPSLERLFAVFIDLGKDVAVEKADDAVQVGPQLDVDVADQGFMIITRTYQLFHDAGNEMEVFHGSCLLKGGHRFQHGTDIVDILGRVEIEHEVIIAWVRDPEIDIGPDQGLYSVLKDGFLIRIPWRAWKRASQSP